MAGVEGKGTKQSQREMLPPNSLPPFSKVPCHVRKQIALPQGNELTSWAPARRFLRFKNQQGLVFGGYLFMCWLILSPVLVWQKPLGKTGFEQVFQLLSVTSQCFYSDNAHTDAKLLGRNQLRNIAPPAHGPSRQLQNGSRSVPRRRTWGTRMLSASVLLSSCFQPLPALG